MGSKGSRLAVVVVLICMVIGAGWYFYETPTPPPTPPGSSTPSSSVESPPPGTSDGSSTSSVEIPVQPPKPKQQAYPAGITPVQKVTADMKGQKVTVKGYAVKMTSGKGHHFYIFRDIVEPGSIKAVVFKAESDNQAVDAPLQNSLNTGSPVTLSGKVDVYKGELEIIVNRASE